MLTRKLASAMLMIAVLGIFAGAVFKNIPKKSVFNSSLCTVLVDAGHGAPDGGAVGVNGTVEKDINLEIAKKTGEVLEGKGIRVLYTREGDEGLQEKNPDTIRKMKVSDMNKRLEIMRKSKADLFLSIHMNSFPKENVSGLRVFYAKNHPEGEELAEKIQDKISSVTGAATYAVKAADEKLFLMKNPPMTSVLVECGFLTNRAEEEKLNDDMYQAKIAWAMADAVEAYLTQNNPLGG